MSFPPWRSEKSHLTSASLFSIGTNQSFNDSLLYFSKRSKRRRGSNLVSMGQTHPRFLLLQLPKWQTNTQIHKYTKTQIHKYPQCDSCPTLDFFSTIFRNGSRPSRNVSGVSPSSQQLGTLCIQGGPFCDLSICQAFKHSLAFQNTRRSHFGI